MCTGRPPFLADSAIAVLLRVRDSTPRPIRELNPDIPDWLIAIIDRLLDKNPDARFQTAQEVSDLLRQHLDELQYRERSQATGPSRGSPETPSVPGPSMSPACNTPESSPAGGRAAESGTAHHGSEVAADRTRPVPRRGEADPPRKPRRARQAALDREGSARRRACGGGAGADRGADRYQAAAIYQGKGKGLVVGPYVVLDRIDTAGTGMVFKALHRELRAVVALKVLPSLSGGSGPGGCAQFRREAESLARIRHPNIVRCFEPVREVDGVYYHVTEYVEGRDLRFPSKMRASFPSRRRSSACSRRRRDSSPPTHCRSSTATSGPPT